jgi:serine/threonine protein kinase
VTLQSSAQTIGRRTDGEVERYGRYEILRKLATGGMGEVYLARSVGAAGFRKHVVIKRILPHLVEQGHFVEALVREAKILVMLDHPNIVQVLDLGFEGGDYFMAMEFVHGYNMATIAHYCAQKRLIIPVPACAAVGLGVLAALEYAHALKGPDGERHNVIHRDVSPQNVMISRDGRVKLTDFGIAKVLNAAEAEFTSSLKGKFRYMAPEALDGGRMDQRYDIFAAGILLFEALCRRHLFGGRSDVDILKQVRAARVPDLERYHPGVPPAVVEVTRRSLERNPSARYQQAADFAAELREAIRPVSESDANAQLRAFVNDLFERPDFPINKPKLPNLHKDLDATRSIVLHSQVSSHGQAVQKDVPEQARQRADALRPAGRLALSLISIVLALLVGVVGYLVYKMPHSNSPNEVKVSYRIEDAQPTNSSAHVAPAPDAASRTDVTPNDAGAQHDGPRARAPDAKARRQGPPPISFTPAIGRKYFGRSGAQIKGCISRYSEPGASISLEVTSRIRSNGRVTAVEIRPRHHSGTPLGKCVARVARKIRYPRHDQALITYRQPVQVRSSE